MLPKENRVSKKTIDRIFSPIFQSSFLRSDNFNFKFFFSKNADKPQISFIVPKTVTKSAVRRNALRRIGYIAVNDLMSTLPSNIVGVFVFGKNAALLLNEKELFQDKLRNEIKNIFNKIN